MTPASHRILSILPARPLDRRQARRPTLCLLRVVVVVLSGHLRLLRLGLEPSAGCRSIVCPVLTWLLLFSHLPRRDDPTADTIRVARRSPCAPRDASPRHGWR